MQQSGRGKRFKQPGWAGGSQGGESLEKGRRWNGEDVDGGWWIILVRNEKISWDQYGWLAAWCLAGIK